MSPARAASQSMTAVTRLASHEQVAVVPVAVHRVRAPQDGGIGRAADVDDLAEECCGFSAGGAYRCVHCEEVDVSHEQRVDDAFRPVAALRHRVLVRLPEAQHLGCVRVLEHLRHFAVAPLLQRVGAPRCRPRPVRVRNRYSPLADSGRDVESIREAWRLAEREHLQHQRSTIGCIHRDRAPLAAGQALDHLEAELVRHARFRRHDILTTCR